MSVSVKIIYKYLAKNSSSLWKLAFGNINLIFLILKAIPPPTAAGRSGGKPHSAG